ncbi:sugar porter family MFS transporter [Brevibacterium sp. 91QC2O2]|uniref:sugar porter family MFS transporter n=1 Tax=Brevibacterium sp. 91QC2O2 TaxID=2968458 RepID=UPI00211BAB77|nr:sugar porter family MFS transporter [Brevibacterium sp. 91QC2O2]MCQ9367115.1 sugar porter family MFS transporter [Brevibacterium sp. 91QC2O2]
MTATSAHAAVDHSKEPITGKVVFIAILAGFSGLLYGYDSGAISGALPPMTEQLGLDAGQQGLITSLLLWGALPSIIGASIAARRFDRRHLLIVAAVIFLVGSLVFFFAPGVGLIGTTRFFLGLGVGIANMFGLIYLSELSPTRIRGLLTGMYQLAVNLGILCAYIVGDAFQASGKWEWILGLGAVPAIVFLVGMIIAPASPRWLITRGRHEDAVKVLSTLRATEDIARAEADEIAGSLSRQTGGIKALFTSSRKPLIVLFILTFFQVFTGINAVVYYAPIIFAESGMGDSAGMYANYGVGIALVVSTAIALPIIDRLGRVKLLAISMAGQTIAMIALWLLPDAGWFSIAAVFVYTFAFGIGMGPVFWLLVPEVLPLSVRAIGTGVITFTQYLFNAVFSAIFPVVLAGIGPWVFFIFAALSALACWYVLARVPETSGKSLEEIEAHWRDASATA